MSAYHYKALNKLGLDSKGIIEADSARHARQLLREKGLNPTFVTALAKKTHSKKMKLTAQDLALFTRQLATLVEASIPLEEALLTVSEQTQKEQPRELIMGVRSKVLQGHTLAQSLEEYPRVFPELYCATIAAGEQTGRLDLMLEKLAQYTENQQEIRQKIQQSLIYPLLMIFISSAIISFLLIFVIPKMVDVFRDSGQPLPAMTNVLINFSIFFKSYGLLALLFITTCLFLIKRALARQIKMRMAWHKLLLKIPLFSYLIICVNVSQYIHTFSILFAAGVSVLDAMRISANLVNNLVIRASFNLAAKKVKEGSAINLALKETGFLNPMSSHLIASGEKSSSLALMMDSAGTYLDNQVKRIIDTGLTLLEPIIILIMGAVVLFIVLATLLPVFSMEQLVN